MHLKALVAENHTHESFRAESRSWIDDTDKKTRAARGSPPVESAELVVGLEVTVSPAMHELIVHLSFWRSTAFSLSLPSLPQRAQAPQNYLQL